MSQKPMVEKVECPLFLLRTQRALPAQGCKQTASLLSMIVANSAIGERRMKDAILNSLALHMRTLRELVGDVDDAQMTRQPPGVPNHPAWTLGHIAFSFQGIGEELGLDPWLPEDWVARFKTGSVPAAERQAYPTRQELLDTLADAEQRLRERLSGMDDAALRRPLPDEQAREILPTLGDAVLQVIVGHTAAHLGQLAVWRRAMGLPEVRVIVSAVHVFSSGVVSRSEDAGSGKVARVQPASVPAASFAWSGAKSRKRCRLYFAVEGTTALCIQRKGQHTWRPSAGVRWGRLGYYPLFWRSRPQTAMHGDSCTARAGCDRLLVGLLMTDSIRLGPDSRHGDKQIGIWTGNEGLAI
jgi:hypothetical protein